MAVFPVALDAVQIRPETRRGLGPAGQIQVPVDPFQFRHGFTLEVLEPDLGIMGPGKVPGILHQPVHQARIQIQHEAVEIDMTVILKRETVQQRAEGPAGRGIDDIGIAVNVDEAGIGPQRAQHGDAAEWTGFFSSSGRPGWTSATLRRK